MIALHLSVPLAASGTAVIGVVVVGSLLLLAVLLHAEKQVDAEESDDEGEESNRDA
jgi:hypothetical protein